MPNHFRPALSFLAGICFLIGSHLPSNAQTASPPPNPSKKGTVMSMRATGTFEVKLVPQSPEDKSEGAALGRMSIDKQFHGDLEGTSKGEMLSAMTAVKGSAGYVAIERFTGALHGHSGTFVLQHSGIMARGAQHQSITVVPDSGTGQLAGISGKMTIIIAAGKHSFEFDYSLPESP